MRMRGGHERGRQKGKLAASLGEVAIDQVEFNWLPPPARRSLATISLSARFPRRPSSSNDVKTTTFPSPIDTTTQAP